MSEDLHHHIYNYNIHRGQKHHHLRASMFIKHQKKYYKLGYNQLLILDALLETGGYEKKYIDKSKEFRFSEHFGLLDFNKNVLEKIIISAKTNREDKDDLDILLPTNLPEIKDYEYMFHTHPPTPYPGARAVDGILYEFPSVSDIYHFADHFNNGETQGSLVIAAEGIYIIRAVDGIKKIKYPNDEKIFKKISKEIFEIQQLAINKYGIANQLQHQDVAQSNNNNIISPQILNNNQSRLSQINSDKSFDLETFYGVIAYDNYFLKMFNQVIENNWGKLINIYLKPRSKNEKTGKWIINSLILPVISYELKS